MDKIIKGLMISLLFITSSPLAIASTNQAGKLWTNFSATGAIKDSKKFKYMLDVQARFGDNESAFEKGLIRTGLGYQLKANFSLWAGYGWFPTIPSETTKVIHEQRLFQQASWNIVKKDKLSTSLRSRLEQRTLQDEPQWAWRLNERLSFKFTKALHDKYTPVLSNEIRFNLNHPDWVSANTISENRAFIGLSFPTSKNTNLLIGYLNQYKFKPSGNSMNHNLYVSLKLKTSP